MPKSRLDLVRKFMPLVATIFVIAGVAAIVLSRPSEQGEANAPTAPSAPAGPDMVTVYQGTEAIHITQVRDGVVETRECPLPQRMGRVQRVSREGIMVGIAGGEGNAAIGFDCVAIEGPVPPGALNASGSHGVRTGDARAGGAGTIIFSDGKNENTVTLRSGNARPYRDPLLIDWMDDERAAVVAFQGDALYALVVERTGRMTQLVALPENATEYGVSSRAFWYVTVSPGPGIEFGPRGPSEVHRVSLDANDEVVARDAEQAIEALTPGPDRRFAFIAGGTLFQGAGSDVKNIGTGRPLGWMDDGALLVQRNGLLTIMTPEGSAVDTSVSVPDGMTRVWRLTLDEPMAGG